MSRAALPDRRIRRRDGAVAAPALPAAPRPAEQLLALQRSAGNAAVGGALAARSFDRAAYQRAMEAKAKFMAMLWAGPSWHPSTGRGNFDVLYEPLTGLLTVTVKCKFWFEDGKPDESAARRPGGSGLDAGGDPEVQGRLRPPRVGVLVGPVHVPLHARLVGGPAGGGPGAFRRIDREGLALQREGAQDPRRRVQAQQRQADQVDPDARPVDARRRRTWTRSTTASTASTARCRRFTRPATCSALGDEYDEERTKKSGIPHEKLVKAEFGHGVPLHDDGRLMSEGDLIVPEYGVTFLEALRVITAMNEWRYDAKPPAPVLWSRWMSRCPRSRARLPRAAQIALA